MIGILLYETLDLGYNVIRLLYNVSTGTYNWYYNIDSKNYYEKKRLEELIIKEKEDNEEILNLNKRIKKLEDYINIEIKKK